MMILTLKVTVAILFTALLIVLLKAITHAAKANRFPDRFSSEIKEHSRWANVAFWLMIVAVGVTEVMVRANGGVQHRGLLVLHLWFAVPFAILLGILRFWITGTNRSATHKLLAYSCAAMYLGALATGMILIWKI